MNSLRKWMIFILERFNPVEYLMMISVFFAAHYVFYVSEIELSLFLHFVPLFLVTVLFFFKLRLFDEIKDLESDKKNFPNRPLPRGLLGKRDVLVIIATIIILELGIFAYYGLEALVIGLVAVLYSLVMYKEFFISKWLKAHLTTYAVSHTAVAVLISISIFAALSNSFAKCFSLEFLLFSFGSWPLFNVFEFGRKSFTTRGERPNINSYSKIFGRLGAVFLVVAMVGIGIGFFYRSIEIQYRFLFFLFGLAVSVAGIIYAKTDQEKYLRIYGKFCAMYIFVMYGIIFLSNFLIKM